MRIFSQLILLVLIVSCKSSPPCEGEIKLTPSLWLEHYKKGNFYEVEDVWIDVTGNSISRDSMMQLDNKRYKSDVVIDCYGVALRNEIRLRTEEDDRIQRELMEYNYYHLDNYLKFIDFFEDDPDLRGRMIDYALKNSAYEPADVDCSQIWEILNRAYYEDQAVRNGDGSNGDMMEVDLRNMKLFSGIVEKCGFDAIKEQGKESVDNAWFIVQHGHIQLRKKHFDDFMKCMDEGLIDMTTMALMIDRMLIDQGKPQIYGSQFGYDPDISGSVLQPVQDFDRMVHLRDSIGLMPIEEYAELLGGVIP